MRRLLCRLTLRVRSSLLLYDTDTSLAFTVIIILLEIAGEIVYTRPNAAYGIGRKAGRGRFITKEHSENHAPYYSN